jgi:hypothetical protein
MTLVARPKKTDSDPKKPNRSGVPLNVNIPPALRAALDKLTERTRRTITAEVEIALEFHCGKEGLWPPPEDSD